MRFTAVGAGIYGGFTHAQYPAIDHFFLLPPLSLEAELLLSGAHPVLLGADCLGFAVLAKAEEELLGGSAAERRRAQQRHLHRRLAPLEPVVVFARGARGRLRLTEGEIESTSNTL